MNSPEEIKKGLGFCAKPDHPVINKCEFCTYGAVPGCEEALKKDALAYIQQLEREMDELVSENYKLKRVRDAAVRDVDEAAPCFACIRFERNGGDCIGAHVCIDDVLQDALGGRYSDYRWEWRGVQEVE